MKTLWQRITAQVMEDLPELIKVQEEIQRIEHAFGDEPATTWRWLYGNGVQGEYCGKSALFIRTVRRYIEQRIKYKQVEELIDPPKKINPWVTKPYHGIPRGRSANLTVIDDMNFADIESRVLLQDWHNPYKK